MSANIPPLQSSLHQQVFSVTQRPHPHFDDRGTLDWHTRWSDAVQSAKAQGKFVLVEFGREA